VAELLLLFDVDRTLLRARDPHLSTAMASALRELTESEEIPDDALAHVEYAGRTARSVARMILRRFGVAAVPDLREWCRLTEQRYEELLADADTSDWRAADGAENALERLASQHRLALVTGEPERVARLRVERLGLARFFPDGQGAYGCESEDRVDLVERARARASDWPAEQTVLVGDAPFAALTARAAGVRSMRIADDGDFRTLTELAADLAGEPEPDAPVVDELTADDWDAVAAIYEAGLEAGTFETEVPSWKVWDEAHLDAPRLVARLGADVVGWAALMPYSPRKVYEGVAEDSIYVAIEARGQGVGRLLLTELVRRAEEAGIWTIQAGCFPENRASIALHESCGFRVVGTRERIAKREGEWRDVVILERRSPQID
jgi:L-amino acid N-acyltransferase YncA/phosphoglycolate phosphatase-like HAD superfamily hydrolase